MLEIALKTSAAGIELHIFRLSSIPLTITNHNQVTRDKHPYLESMGRDDADISGQTISEFHFDDVTDHELLGAHVQLVTVADDESEL